MTQPPPALTAQPQFTALYWDKAVRAKEKVKLVRMTNMPDSELMEFAFDNGAAFQRRKSELNPDIDLHVNLLVYVETINNELVTGMWIPEQGWAFRMTSQDLADYAKKLMSAMYEQRQAADNALRGFLALAIRDAVFEQRGEDVAGVDWDAVATMVMDAMQQGPNSSANAR